MMWIAAGVAMLIVAILGALRFESAVKIGTAVDRLNPLHMRGSARSPVRLVVGVWLAAAGAIGALFVVLNL